MANEASNNDTVAGTNRGGGTNPEPPAVCAADASPRSICAEHLTLDAVDIAIERTIEAFLEPYLRLLHELEDSKQNPKTGAVLDSFKRNIYRLLDFEMDDVEGSDEDNDENTLARFTQITKVTLSTIEDLARRLVECSCRKEKFEISDITTYNDLADFTSQILQSNEDNGMAEVVKHKKKAHRGTRGGRNKKTKKPQYVPEPNNGDRSDGLLRQEQMASNVTNVTAAV